MNRRGSRYYPPSPAFAPYSPEYAYPPVGRRPSWRAVTPEPEVFLPHHSPYFYHPFLPRYVAPGYMPPYVRAREKDLGLLMKRNLAGSAATPVPASVAPADGGKHRLQRWRQAHVTEAPGDPDFDDVWDDIDLDLWDEEEWLRGEDDWLGGEEKVSKRPFKALSRLFASPEGGESKAVKLIKAARIVQRAGPGKEAEAAAQAAAQALAPSRAAVPAASLGPSTALATASPAASGPPERKGPGGGAVVAGVVAGAALLGLGLWAGTRMRSV